MLTRLGYTFRFDNEVSEINLFLKTTSISIWLSSAPIPNMTITKLSWTRRTFSSTLSGVKLVIVRLSNIAVISPFPII